MPSEPFAVSDGILPLGGAVGIHGSTSPKMPIHLPHNAKDARYEEIYDKKNNYNIFINQLKIALSVKCRDEQLKLTS
ncbi:hypothetical protein [Neisseria bergeri]|uniref:hypothetical protein n=1 Tax=Neisseria bergeri TaxID=1906581 RepID=UPI00142E6AAD|nr:hypothetical protein [Neisseria bergeri]